MHFPTRVLPSNAPPLSEDDGVHQASRALQEQSITRHQNDFSFDTTYDFERHYPLSVLTNHAPILPGVHHPQHLQQQLPQLPQQYPAPQPYVSPLYQPLVQHRSPLRCGYTWSRYRPGPEEETRIRFEADRLYQRFCKSDQYSKYRHRQEKDEQGSTEQKWPDHLEKAFFRALIQWPPMGRRKTLHKDKQRGRNELIADCIEELTGVMRTRKQVSSHIQVLKPFVEHDPMITKWLSKHDMFGKTRHNVSSSSYSSGRRMSNYPVSAPSQPVCGGTSPHIRIDPFGLQRLKPDLNIFRPTEFEMFVQQRLNPSGDHEEFRRLHTYTSSAEGPFRPNESMSDWQALAETYPLLWSMHLHRPLYCNVLSAEAELAFPPGPWKKDDGTSLPGVELGISFLCHSLHLPANVNRNSRDNKFRLVVHNTFYEGGLCIKDHSGSSEVPLEYSDERGRVETQIKFGSGFWAITLWRLAARLLDPTEDHRAEVAAYLGSITVVQEIFGFTGYGHERLLVIHWKFKLHTGIQGRTSWYRVLLPPSDAPRAETIKAERADSMYDDHSAAPAESMLLSNTSQPYDQPVMPTLQSPFEYDASSSTTTGSFLSSAVWPSSHEDPFALSLQHQQQQQNHQDLSLPIDFHTDTNTNTSYDFPPGANLPIPYDPCPPTTDLHLTDAFNTSSAFPFDLSPAAPPTATVPPTLPSASPNAFPADPLLQDCTPNLHPQHWYDNNTDYNLQPFDYSVDLSEANNAASGSGSGRASTSFISQHTESDHDLSQHELVCAAFGAQYPCAANAAGEGTGPESQQAYAGAHQHGDLMDGCGRSGGGVGGDGEEAAALAALGDVSFLEGGLGGGMEMEMKGDGDGDGEGM